MTKEERQQADLEESQRKYEQEQSDKEVSNQYAEDMGIDYPSWSK